MTGLVVLLLVLAVAAVLIVRRGGFGPALLTDRDAVVLTEIENRTGDKLLDESVATALEMALRQSPYLFCGTRLVTNCCVRRC